MVINGLDICSLDYEYLKDEDQISVIPNTYTHPVQGGLHKHLLYTNQRQSSPL